MKYQYDKLKRTYGDFLLPVVNVIIEGKPFHTNKRGAIIGEIQVELTSGYEASAASFHIYNCTAEEDGKYMFDDLKSYIFLGSFVVIEMGYAKSLTEVFRGFIAQVEFAAEENGIPCVEVTAMDVKAIMMANAYTKQMTAERYSEAVREIFQKETYQKLSQRGIIDNLNIADTPDKQEKGNSDISEPIEMTSESDYEFVVKAAKKFNCEFFTELGTLHFRKAKQETDPVIELEAQKGILSYRVGYDIRGMVQEIETRGIDDRKGVLIHAKKKFKNKVSYGNKAGGMISKAGKVYVDSSIRSQDEAASRAEALIEQMSYRLGSLQCECVGIPEIRPGYFICIAGFGEPVDNQFYITDVKHTLKEEEGFTTKIIGAAASVEAG